MKKGILMLVAFLLCFGTACETPQAAEQVPSSPEAVIQEAKAKVFSEDEVRQIFLNEPGNAHLTITGCVTASDRAYELAGVVRYTDDTGNPSWLAFVRENGSYPVGLDAENTLQVDISTPLTYEGNGVVSCAFFDPKTEAVYDYTISYSYSEDENGVPHTHFKAESTAREAEK